MKLEEVKEKDKYHRDIVRGLYEEYGKQFIGKFYKKEHFNEHSYFGERSYTTYLYIHGVGGTNLSAIEFRDATIQRVGIWMESFDWEEISLEEFQKGLQEYIEFFKLDGLLEVKK